MNNVKVYKLKGYRLPNEEERKVIKYFYKNIINSDIVNIDKYKKENNVNKLKQKFFIENFIVSHIILLIFYFSIKYFLSISRNEIILYKFLLLILFIIIIIYNYIKFKKDLSSND